MFAPNTIDSLLDAIDDIVGLLELPVPNTSSPTLILLLIAVANVTVDELDTAFATSAKAGS